MTNTTTAPTGGTTPAASTTATAAATAAELATELASAAAAEKAAASKLGSIVIMNDYINGSRRDFPAIVSGINADATLAVFAMPPNQAGRPIKTLALEGKQKAGMAFYYASYPAA